jgi:outer membrane protein assembly factor BamE
MRTTVFSRIHPSSTRLNSRRARALPLSSALLAAFALGGCTMLNGEELNSNGLNAKGSLKRIIAFMSPYKPDIVQGNVVTTEQISQIKTGMSRAQVRDILGSPLISDPFHAQRWDYVFTLKRQGFDDQKRAFVVLFDKDAVEKIDAPELPTEDQFVAAISRKKLPETTPKLVLTDEERAALPLPKPAVAAASATVLAGATRSYPPLESTTP